MSVAFVHGTHYFFSASKAGTIRYWDADKFEHIHTLDGHRGEVWSVVPSRSGRLVVSKPLPSNLLRSLGLQLSEQNEIISGSDARTACPFSLRCAIGLVPPTI